jgi:hypothetical protein
MSRPRPQLNVGDRVQNYHKGSGEEAYGTITAIGNRNVTVKYDVGGETKEAPDKLVVALPPFTPLVALSSPAASSKEQQPNPALSSPGNRSAFVRPGVDYARALQNNNNKRLLSTQSTPTKSAEQQNKKSKPSRKKKKQCVVPPSTTAASLEETPPFLPPPPTAVAAIAATETNKKAPPRPLSSLLESLEESITTTLVPHETAPSPPPPRAAVAAADNASIDEGSGDDYCEVVSHSRAAVAAADNASIDEESGDDYCEVVSHSRAAVAAADDASIDEDSDGFYDNWVVSEKDSDPQCCCSNKLVRNPLCLARHPSSSSSEVLLGPCRKRIYKHAIHTIHTISTIYTIPL